MSIETIARVFDYSGQKGSALVVLLALAEWADHDSITYYGNAAIARRSRLSVASVKRIMSALRDAGEIYAPPVPGYAKRTPKLITIGLDNTEVTAILSRRFEMDPAAATVTTAAIYAARAELQKGIKSDTLNGRQKGIKSDTLDDQKGIKSDTLDDQKGIKSDTLNGRKGIRADTLDGRKGIKSDTRSLFPIDLDQPDNSVKGGSRARANGDGGRGLALLQALAAVCQLDPAHIRRHAEQCATAAAQLMHIAPADIYDRYGADTEAGAGGWNWYSEDWRGRRGEAPTLQNVIETIGRQRTPAAASNFNGHTPAADLVNGILAGD